MSQIIEPGFMAFLREGEEGIGAIREVLDGAIVVYVENGGEFRVPNEAIRSVHDGKVILKPELLDRRLIEAIGHAHDREDPRVAG